MEPSNAYRLHSSLGYQLSLAARVQEKRLEEGLKTLGLTRITWCILLAIGNEGLQQPSEIARFVGIDRTATSRALRHMEASAMVQSSTRPGDGRTRRVWLTDHGRRLLDQGTPMAVANNQIMYDRLSDRELQDLLGLLQKLHSNETVSLSSF